MRSVRLSILVLTFLLSVSAFANDGFKLVSATEKPLISKNFSIGNAATIFGQSDQIFRMGDKILFLGETELDDGARCFIAIGTEHDNAAGSIDNVNYYIPNDESGSWGCTEIKSIKFFNYQQKVGALVLVNAVAMLHGEPEFIAYSAFEIDPSNGKITKISVVDDFIYRKGGEFMSKNGQSKFSKINSMYQYLSDNKLL